MRVEKTAMVNEVRTQVEGGTFMLVTDYRGLNVDQFGTLRRRLRGAGAQVHVVKNRLFRHVVAERGWTRLNDVLRGPSAVVTGSDVTQAAKVLKQFSGETGGMSAVKAGMFGNTYLSPADVTELANLPSREVLLGMVVGTVAAPLARLAGVMRQKLASVVYVLKAAAEKKSAA